MNPRKLFRFIALLLPLSAFGFSMEPARYVTDIENGSNEDLTYIRITCADGAKFEYQFPDPDNEANSAEDLRSVLALLYEATSANLPVLFVRNGQNGEYAKINGLRIQQP